MGPEKFFLDIVGVEWNLENKVYLQRGKKTFKDIYIPGSGLLVNKGVHCSFMHAFKNR